mmetsp:Transcript_5599/g.12499  ORF Transcript_5599/g.12499 Transcript_5599/m.12499 type:complete len:185 (+) Transcript_5599:108-662(+)
MDLLTTLFVTGAVCSFNSVFILLASTSFARSAVSEHITQKFRAILACSASTNVENKTRIETKQTFARNLRLPKTPVEDFRVKVPSGKVSRISFTHSCSRVRESPLPELILLSLNQTRCPLANTASENSVANTPRPIDSQNFPAKPVQIPDEMIAEPLSAIPAPRFQCNTLHSNHLKLYWFGFQA